MGNDALISFEKQIKGYNDAILMGEEDIFTMTKEQADKAIKSLRQIVGMDNIAKTLQQDMVRLIIWSNLPKPPSPFMLVLPVKKWKWMPKKCRHWQNKPMIL